jgi:hypothetical protein
MQREGTWVFRDDFSSFLSPYHAAVLSLTPSLIPTWAPLQQSQLSLAYAAFSPLSSGKPQGFKAASSLLDVSLAFLASPASVACCD